MKIRKIEMDINWDMELGVFLEILEKHNIELESFIAVGPGGGNPCIQLSGTQDDLEKAFHLEEVFEAYCVT